MISCQEKEAKTEAPWILDRFDDIKVLRYEVPGFAELPLEEKELIYYLSEAAKCGRDILFDQNFKYNLPIRRTLEVIYENYEGDRETAEWKALEKYLKKVWFANGIHHHYSNDKFTPEFSREYFLEVTESIPLEKFGDELNALRAVVCEAIFNPDLYRTGLNQTEGEDLIVTSSNNFYEGVTQAEVEDFYHKMVDADDPTPISYGLNSKLVKDENGEIRERVWKVGGMYSPAIEKIVYWLRKAQEVAKEPQKSTIGALIAYYETGDLREFDRYNVLWVKDTISNVDFVNGFIEDYGDPLGRKASWESVVNFMDKEACHRTEIISDNAQWFEDHSPVDSAYKKEVVKGVSAKVITAAILGGDCYPATPIGINLPNADWIRKEYGSKSVTIDNITYAYDKAAQGNGFLEEFMLRAEDRDRIAKYGKLADDLHTDLHECLGHGSGQLAPGVRGNELRNYTSTLEEARADLFGLYYLGDEKMVELGLIPSLDVAYAEYAKYIMNGMMTQLSRIEPGKNVEEAHMRNRKMICEWCYERGKAENVIEWVNQDGKSYIVVNDYAKLRDLFGQMLREVQRIKSEGDYEAGKALVETYAVKVDPELHSEVLERYAALDIEPYAGFVNPEYELVMDGDKIVDVKVSYPNNYVEQMLEYSRDYSFLPNLN
ncbi:MAG TPA: dipeptidyl peptidase 3 [Candidatus Alistipes avicola]|uniref:Dipeptidyl peptidase 3 n=1 Tax=Candidatus Alistipes avicola TaxID=2838432 RepID=A0A9D2ICN8_9BACT|nr:dipeptidyl peptidase 3 [Candidatus Alistipes avicola]